jgi:hypothetical protein
MSLFETKCPMCKGTLWIDSSTLRIVDHREADRKKADLAQFLKDSKQDKGWDAKMMAAREEEARRKAEIEEKFKRAREDKSLNDGTPPGGLISPLDWD